MFYQFILSWNIIRCRYLKVLIQEMTVKADQGFINTLIPFFGEGEKSPEQQAKDFEQDLSGIKQSLGEVSKESVSQGQKNFYDELHFSPLKVCMRACVRVCARECTYLYSACTCMCMLNFIYLQL